jgi:hypothetical protein
LFDTQQAVIITLPKASRYLSKPQHLESKTSITLHSPLRRTDLTNKTNQAKLYQPNPGSSNNVRVYAAHDREHDY